MKSSMEQQTPRHLDPLWKPKRFRENLEEIFAAPSDSYFLLLVLLY